MAVIRVVKDKNFITMSKYHLQEKEMSLKAKGLLSQMLSLPENWDYSIVGLTKINKDGLDSIKATLKELETFGYLRRTRVKGTGGKYIDIEYTIYEKPQVGNPLVEKPYVENPPQLNNKELNNKEIKKEINKERKEDIESIVHYLNLTLGTKYRECPNTVKHINARLDEGYTLDDFFDVIDNKYEEWKDTDMEKYLRPDTLFGTKFDIYLNQKRK